MSVDVGGSDTDSTLRVQSDSIGEAEKFQIDKNDDGSFALKSIPNGMYVSVENKEMKANQNSINAMSKFSIMNVDAGYLGKSDGDSSDGFFTRNKGQHTSNYLQIPSSFHV